MDKFFQRFFPDEPRSVRTYHAILQSCLPAQGAVLDLGCGDHQELARYRTTVRQVWGVDFAYHPRLGAAAWFRLLGDEGSIPFPSDFFDVVASTWVLEHVACPVRFLREVQRVLRPGGRFVALTANGRHYVTAITRLLTCLPHEITQQLVLKLYGRVPEDTHPTHFRLNTPGQIQSAARLAALRWAGIRHFANPDYFSFSQPLRRAAIVTDWLLEKLFPGLGRLYVVVTLEKPAASTAAVERKAA